MFDAVVAAKVPAANIDGSFVSGGLPAALRAGKFTACVIGFEDAILEHKTDPTIDLGLFLGPPQSLAFAVRKGEPELLTALNDYLEGFRKTGSWNRLAVKYFGEAALEILRQARGCGSKPAARPRGIGRTPSRPGGDSGSRIGHNLPPQSEEGET